MPKEVTNEELARMIAKGFGETASKTDLAAVKADVVRLESRFEGELKHIKGEVQHINATLSVVATDIADIRKHFVYRNEFEDLMARVKYLETKLGVESGK